jgi:V8-like Glu-specific endopeptidase
VGDPLRLVGFPAARPFTTLGTVAAVTDRELLVSLPTEPGASGSPLVAADGTVVGQIFARTVDGQGLATPIVRLLAAAREAVPARGC